MGSFLFAEKFTGTAQDMASVFVWGFTIDISVDAGFTPSHVSATSKALAEALHTVPAATFRSRGWEGGLGRHVPS